MTATDERAHEVISRLVSLHDSVGSIDGDGDVRALLVAYGWWTRIVRTVQAIALLHGANLAHEAAPLVRCVIHHCVALEWLIDHPEEAMPALAWEADQQGWKMFDRALARSWNLDLEVAPVRPTDKAPVGIRYLRSADDLCNKAAMPDAYVAFLSESKHAHPTVFSAYAYISESEGRPVLLASPSHATSLRGAAMFAAGATRRFAIRVALTDVATEALALSELLETGR